MFEEIGSILSGMVSIPTVSGKGNEALYRIEDYRAFLEKTFRHLFSVGEVTPVREARIVKIAGNSRDSKPVLFTGHMDVVPAVDEAAWKHPPFSGAIGDGEIWGRGSQDMKGPHCALLSSLDTALAEGWRPKRDVYLYLSCDEEIGGHTTDEAARYFEDRGIQFACVFDEGGTVCENFMGLMDGTAALFGLGEKGSLEYRLTAKAAGGHAANPPKGSAIARLADLISAMEHECEFKKELSPVSRMMLTKLAETEQDSNRRQKLLAAAREEGAYPVLHELCPQADSLLGATAAFTMISGGTAFNVLPKEASLTINVRVSAVQTKAEVTEILTKLAERFDISCTLVSGTDASTETSFDNEYVRMMRKSVEAVYPGLPVIPFILAGGTDSRHFEKVTDAALRFSPMHAAPRQGAGVHGDNESAYVEDVKKAAECYYYLWRTFI